MLVTLAFFSNLFSNQNAPKQFPPHTYGSFSQNTPKQFPAHTRMIHGNWYYISYDIRIYIIHQRIHARIMRRLVFRFVRARVLVGFWIDLHHQRYWTHTIRSESSTSVGAGVFSTPVPSASSASRIVASLAWALVMCERRAGSSGEIRQLQQILSRTCKQASEDIII